MISIDSQKKEKYRFCVNISLLICFVAHGYRYVNSILGHDALSSLVQHDIYWQRSLGRFAQIAVLAFRGDIAVSWIPAVLFAIFMTSSVVLVVRMFDVNSKIVIALIAGVMICNMTVTSANAGFYPWIDIYAIALFLSILGLSLCLTEKAPYSLLGILCLVLSLGLYQAYICVAFALGIVVISEAFLNENNTKKVAKKMLRLIESLLIAGVLYFIAMKGVLLIHHVNPAESYNSLKLMDDYSDTNILRLLIASYEKYVYEINNVGTFSSIYLSAFSISSVWLLAIRIANAITVFILFAKTIYLFFKKSVKMWRLLVYLLCIAVFPLASNFVFVLSKGMEHSLMIYSFNMIYVWSLVVIDGFISGRITGAEEKDGNRFRKIFRIFSIVGTILLTIIVWNNVVFSNQVYYKLDLQQRATLSMVTRLADDIEKQPGYEQGVTQVALVGTFSNSEYIKENDAFARLDILGTDNTSLSYGGLERQYFEYVLNRNVNWVDPDSSIIDSSKDMPVWPQNGSINYDNEVMVVKISE